MLTLDELARLAQHPECKPFCHPPSPDNGRAAVELVRVYVVVRLPEGGYVEVPAEAVFVAAGERQPDGKEKGRLLGPASVAIVCTLTSPAPPPAPQVEYVTLTPEPPPFDGSWENPTRDPRVNFRGIVPDQERGKKESADG